MSRGQRGDSTLGTSICTVTSPDSRTLILVSEPRKVAMATMPFPLLLAAGQLVRVLPGLVGEPDQAQQLGRLASPLRAGLLPHP